MIVLAEGWLVNVHWKEAGPEWPRFFPMYNKTLIRTCSLSILKNENYKSKMFITGKAMTQPLNPFTR